MSWPIRVFFKHTSDQVLCDIYIHTDHLHIQDINILSRSSFSSWDGKVAIKMVGAQKHPTVSKRVQVYRPSTLRFIPRGDEVPRVLIHLLFLIFRRHASWLQSNSIAMTAMPNSSCVPLFKCSAAGDFSPLMCDVISVTINSHMKRLTRLAYILKATTPSHI